MTIKNIHKNITKLYKTQSHNTKLDASQFTLISTLF